MATNNSFQAINASVDDISTESVLNEGLDLPISTKAEAKSIAPFSWEVLQDRSANFSVTIARMAEAIQQTVGQFASDPGFGSKMALAFGAGNDYSGLKSAWQAGTFDAFPQIKIRTGAELVGANAAYAGATNTIYVSQDFLRQNANNSQAIASVLVEEFGHSVDWSVNAIDSPGDEGELFSAIVRGVNLAPSQIQQMNQENDSVVLNFSGSSIQAEKSGSYPFNFHSVLNQLIDDGGKTRVIFINGGIIGNDEGIRTSWNKLNASLKLDGSSWIPVQSAQNNGSVWFDPVVNPNKDDFSKDIKGVFQGIIDRTKSTLNEKISLITERLSNIQVAFSQTTQDIWSYINSFGNNPIDWNRLPKAISELQNTLASFVDPALTAKISHIQHASSAFVQDGINNATQELTNFITSLGQDPVDLSTFNLSFQELKDGVGDLSNYFQDIFQTISSLPNALDLYLVKQKPLAWDYIKNTITSGDIASILAPLGPDVKELISQYVYADTSESKAVNQEWLQGDGKFWQKSEQWSKNTTSIDDSIFSWLDQSIVQDQNSVIFIPDSQGNFFVEDGLRDLNQIDFDLSRVKVIATASETKYWDAGGNYPNFEIKSAVGDPLLDLQADVGGIEIIDPDVIAQLKFIDMLGHLALYAWKVWGPEGIGFDEAMNRHSFDDHYAYKGDVPNPELRNAFNQLFQELHPQGYYFPNDPIQATGLAEGTKDDFPNDPIQSIGFAEGTKDDDWLEGGGLDDTLSGLSRNDVLRGNAGNDTLIGGSGYDLLDGGVGKDIADYYSSPQGIVVSAKTIAGSDVYEVQDGFGTVDTLGNIEVVSGTKFKDIFNGSEFSDIFNGKEGDDDFYGNGGDDKLYGGEGNDYLYGNEGDDWLEGGTGVDWLRGGAGDDKLYGNEGNDWLYGNEGNDLIEGRSGDDWLEGGVDNDKLFGNEGTDYLYGNEGDDLLEGGVGDDRLFGETGKDLLYGGDGNDYLYGGDNDDRLYGEDGNDQLFGENGSDTIVGGAGRDIIRGGAGKDIIFGDFQNGLSAPTTNVVPFNSIPASNPSISSLRTAAVSAMPLAAAPPQLYADEIYGGEDDDTIYAGLDDDFVSGESGNDDIYGESGNDVLFGDSGSDLIAGGIGGDIISGGADNDELWGEDGEDTITGDAGNDLIYGGEDNDTLSGGLDNDRIYGEGGNDIISGDAGNDQLFGQDGNDIIDGGTGDDTLEAGNGLDTLNGGDGIDRLYGQNDNDILNGDAGNDFLDGGDGADTLSGGAGNDELLGQAGNDVMYGNAGDDAIDGGAGKDYLEGNEGNDILNGGADIDTLYGNDGDDILNGDDGRDTLFGGAGNDRINGGGDVDMVSYLTSPSGVVVNLDEGENYRNDRQANANAAINPDNPAAYYTDLEADFAINSGSAADGYGNTDTLLDLENITGSQFADVLIGNDRNNTIFGLGGDDLLVGGGDNDIFYGGNGIDTVSYRRSWGSVDVNLEYNQASGADGYDRIFDIENIVGSRFNDTLTGDAKANIITAGGGNDTVSGGAGDDTLYGESGDDQVSGGIGNDTLYGNLGKDTLNGDAGDDLGYGGAGDDRLNGGDGIDTLWGDQGNDALNGGTGDDFLDGGIGNDTLNGNEGNDQLFGQAGDDLLDGGTGNDVLSGGDGNDQLFGQAGDDFLDGGLGDDQLFGGDGIDTLNGQAGDDLLEGGAGNDILSGGDGKDQLFGQAGDDSLEGGTGNDFLDGGLGNDTLSGGDGNDQLFGQVGNDILDGGSGDDLLDGGIGNDTLSGGSGNDQLLGQAGDDTLNGGLGDDLLKGGEGSDILSGGGGRDRFYINRGEGSDAILDFTGVGRGTNPAPYLIPEIDTIVFSGADLFAKTMLLSQVGGNLVISFEDINNTGVTLQNFALQNLDNHHIDTGSPLTVGNILFEGDFSIQDSFDVINAEVNPTQVLRRNFVTFLNDLANKTNGFDYSDDVINGQGGNDTLRGLGGNDILRGGEGNDILIGGAGQDYLAGQSGNDYLEGGLDDDYLRGGDGNDFLSGGFGNDLIEGGLGNDQMFGAGGRDRFVIYRGDGVDAIADFDGIGPGYQPDYDIINEADILQFLGTGLIAKNMILTQTDYEPATGSSLVITFEGITDTSITLNNFLMENLDNLQTLGSNGSALGNVLFQFDGDDIIKDSFDVFNADWVLNQVLNTNRVTFLNDLDNEISGFDWSDDIINGQGGNDILLGLGGDDILRGGFGNDVLLGGTGTNTLTGNTGFDTFVLSLGGSSFINDFTIGEDFIGLSDGLTFEQLKIEQGTGVNAGSTSIKLLGDESILMSLKGVQANALDTTVFLPASSIFQSSLLG